MRSSTLNCSWPVWKCWPCGLVEEHEMFERPERKKISVLLIVSSFLYELQLFFPSFWFLSLPELKIKITSCIIKINQSALCVHWIFLDLRASSPALTSGPNLLCSTNSREPVPSKAIPSWGVTITTKFPSALQFKNQIELLLSLYTIIISVLDGNRA